MRLQSKIWVGLVGCCLVACGPVTPVGSAGGEGVTRVVDTLYQSSAVTCLDATSSQGSLSCVVLAETAPYQSVGDPIPVCSMDCCQVWALRTTNAIVAQEEPALMANRMSTACQSETTTCYCAVTSQANVCPGGSVAGIWFKDNMPPIPTPAIRFQCAGQ